MIRKQGNAEILATHVELEHEVSAGLWQNTVIPGTIPLIEEHTARLERGIDLETWGKMNSDEKALLVAVRRVNIAIHNLQQEAEIEAQERNMRK